MQKKLITKNANQTRELGKLLAVELQEGTAATHGAQIICLSGELGAGKTTFTQGLLEGLGLTGPFTSPTFLIMKEYYVTRNTKNGTKKTENKINPTHQRTKICHIDAYRIGQEDLRALGWEEMVANPGNVIIIEWAERVSGIIPKDALLLDFEWKGEEERGITLKSK